MVYLWFFNHFICRSASLESNAVINNPVLASHLLSTVSKSSSVASSSSPSSITSTTTPARQEEVRPQPRIRIFERPLADSENIAPTDDNDGELVDSVVINDGSPNGKESVDDINGPAGVQNEDDMNDLMELIAGHEKNEQLNGSSKRAASADNFSTTASTKRSRVAAVLNGSETMASDVEKEKGGEEDATRKCETNVTVTPPRIHETQAKEPASVSSSPPCVTVDGKAKALLCLNESPSLPVKTGDNSGGKNGGC